jgi:hypothetical protein
MLYGDHIYHFYKPNFLAGWLYGGYKQLAKISGL